MICSVGQDMVDIQCSGVVVVVVQRTLKRGLEHSSLNQLKMAVQRNDLEQASPRIGVRSGGAGSHIVA
jgi:hypothetical protein